MGYDVSRFTDEPVDGEFLCSICLGVFEDPLQSPCGHVYCSACIKNWLIPGLPVYRMDPDFWPDQPVLESGGMLPQLAPQVGQLGPQLGQLGPQVGPGTGRGNMNPRTCCPMDKRPLTRSDLRPIPLPLKAILSKLEIRCGFESCSYKCPLSEVGTHESTCELNPSSEITCPKCSRRMARSERTNHDCIQVLKEVVEKLEREVEKLKKKRKFPNSPFSAHGSSSLGSSSLGSSSLGSSSLGTSSLGTSVPGSSSGRDGVVPLSNASHQYYGPTAFGPPGIVRGTNSGAEGQPIMMAEPSLRPSIAPNDPPAGQIINFHHRNRNSQGQVYQEGATNHSVIRRSLNHNHPYHVRSAMSPPVPRHGDGGERSEGTVSRMSRYRVPHMRHEENGQSSVPDWEPVGRSHMRQLRVVPPPSLNSPLNPLPGPTHTTRNSSPRNSGINYTPSSPRNNGINYTPSSPRNIGINYSPRNSPRTSHSPRGTARTASDSGPSSNHHQVVAMDGSMVDFPPDLEFID